MESSRNSPSLCARLQRDAVPKGAAFVAGHGVINVAAVTLIPSIRTAHRVTDAHREVYEAIARILHLRVGVEPPLLVGPRATLFDEEAFRPHFILFKRSLNVEINYD